MRQIGGAARGIGHSLRLYYGDAERHRRMDALHARFVGAGGLAFDIGAHVGDRIASFRRLGARVVAAEPQPAALRALRLIHGRDPEVTILPCAMGPVAGRLRLQINTRNPTVSTVSPDFVAAARAAEGWQGQAWDAVVEVETVTLDALVARHGLPDFVKIDVEGYEEAVLAGLGHAPRALSFEFTTIQRAVADRSVARIASLGRYAFNLSLGEEHRLRLDAWTSGAALREILAGVPDSANSGDVYARLP